jgi:hypothetical protein
MLRLLLSLALIIFLLSSISAIRISEVEMNPVGTDAGNEWIELYNDGDISLEEYMVVNGDGKNISLNNTFNGYFVYTFTKQWLDNSNESVSLYKNSELIDKTDSFDDPKNDDFTHQFCSSSWKFMASTKGSENNCTEPIQEQTQTTTNETTQQTQQESDNSETEETSDEDNTESKQASQASPKPKTKATTLDVIDLNSKDIKSDNNKETLKENLALGGIVTFCLGFGALFFLKFAGRKSKNEFR